jgi:hypothetical protein
VQHCAQTASVAKHAIGGYMPTQNGEMIAATRSVP